MAPTTQREALRLLIAAIAEAVREAKEIPAGHLYAMLLGVCTLDQFNRIIAALVHGGHIQKRNNLLTWTGKAVQL